VPGVANAPRLLITDTGPLITLAAADALDYLLIPQIPVIVPDAVLYEATINSNAIGAASISEWSQGHVDLIQIIVTIVFTNHVAALERGLAREPDLGERAALEVGRHTPLLGPGEQALLLTEDDRVIRGSFFDPEDAERIMVLTTHDFLIGLERAQRINSAEAVYQRAEDAGRLATRRRALTEQHEAAMAAVASIMKTSDARARP
jgi:hypothetical protein